MWRGVSTLMALILPVSAISLPTTVVRYQLIAYLCGSRLHLWGAGHFEDLQLSRVDKDHIALLKP